MNRVLKTALVCGAAVTLASCGTVREMLPFNLGRTHDVQATATEGQRISVLEFEQQLTPSAALSGRDFFLPGPQAAVSWPNPGGTAENAIEHVIAAPEFAIAWRRNIGTGSSDTRQVMAPVVADGGKVFVMDGESRVTALDATTGGATAGTIGTPLSIVSRRLRASIASAAARISCASRSAWSRMSLPFCRSAIACEARRAR